MRLKAYVVATLASLLACSSQPAGEETDDQTADELQMADGDMKLFFTNPLGDLVRRGVLDKEKASIRSLLTRKVGDGDRPDEELVKMINAAKGEGCSVLLSDYDYDIQIISDAMVRAKERGCDVRMITDGDTIDRSEPGERAGRRKPFKEEYKEPFRVLRRARIPIHHDGARGTIMHNKFVVVNGKYVWTGGWNMSQDDTHKFFNNAAMIRSKEAAKRYTVAFEELFAKYDAEGSTPDRASRVDQPDPANHTFDIGDRKVEVYFPRLHPTLKRITELTKTAQKSIHFMAFSFTDADLGNAMVDRAKEGVDVRGIFENSGACNGQFKRLSGARGVAKENISVLRWKYGPINFMHHKVIVIDKKITVFASFNFSSNADTGNDENVVIVHDAAIAKVFEQEFDRVEDATKEIEQPPSCAAGDNADTPEQ